MKRRAKRSQQSLAAKRSSRIRAASRRWRRRHPERQRAATYSWRERNRARWNAYQRRWRRAHPARVRLSRKRQYQAIRRDPQKWSKHLAAGRRWRAAYPERERERHGRYRSRNRLRMRIYQRKWMRRWNRTHRQEARRRSRERRAQNVEAWRVRDRAYYQQSRRERPEQYARKLSGQRAWAKRNRAKLTYWTSRYRARRGGAPGAHTFAEWQARIRLFGWRCFHCRKRLTRTTITKDHLVPLFRGGSEDAQNLVPACKSCNSAKRDRLEWKKKGARKRPLP
jgi:hypothetical protein